ncbi:MAG: UBP-type zinc finger domain-containing protein, partial [Pseudonocardiaceae bacterium]
CCDSSPHRHATVHYYRTDHPVIRSAEPGEAWRWCYPDHQLV